jgi:hypothetical protein
MKRTHVSWRWPYLITGISGALLFGQERVRMSAGWHEALELAIVIVMFGLLARWLQRNEADLEAEDLRREVEQQAAERGQTRLTPIQANYLAAEARRAKEHTNGNLSRTHR